MRYIQGNYMRKFLRHLLELLFTSETICRFLKLWPFSSVENVNNLITKRASSVQKKKNRNSLSCERYEQT